MYTIAPQGEQYGRYILSRLKFFFSFLVADRSRRTPFSGKMKSSNGYVVSKCRAFFFLVAFVGSLVAVGLLVYYLADRPYPSGASPNGSSSSASTAGKTPPNKSDKNVRLPRAVLPRRYDVRLFPILEKGNFSILGRVSIEVECKQETDRIVLHSADIAVEPKSVRVTTRN